MWYIRCRKGLGLLFETIHVDYYMDFLCEKGSGLLLVTISIYFDMEYSLWKGLKTVVDY